MSIAPRDEDEVQELIAAELTNTPDIVEPEGWPRPRGYSNGAVATGKIVTVAGQIGWNPVTGKFESDDFASQTRQTLHNVVDVLLAANARPQDLPVQSISLRGRKLVQRIVRSSVITIRRCQSFSSALCWRRAPKSRSRQQPSFPSTAD